MVFGLVTVEPPATIAMMMTPYMTTQCISEEITVGNSNVMMVKKIGKLRCEILQKNGEKLIITLQDVKYVPDLWINFFSIGKALKNGFNLGNDGEKIKLMKGNVTILFDRFLTSKNGFYLGSR